MRSGTSPSVISHSFRNFDSSDGSRSSNAILFRPAVGLMVPDEPILRAKAEKRFELGNCPRASPTVSGADQESGRPARSAVDRSRRISWSSRFSTPATGRWPSRSPRSRTNSSATSNFSDGRSRLRAGRRRHGASSHRRSPRALDESGARGQSLAIVVTAEAGPS